MNIHEYQAKALLGEFGVAISKGAPVLKAADSDAAAKSLPGPVWVVKSQIHAGGNAGHGPDRAARQTSQSALCRGRLRHRQGVLAFNSGEPRNLGGVVRG